VLPGSGLLRGSGLLPGSGLLRGSGLLPRFERFGHGCIFAYSLGVPPEVIRTDDDWTA